MSETLTAKALFLRRVRLRNFKSIAYCDVTLEPLTILVGRNGTGKSNFIEALAFLRDCVDTNLNRAIRDHGGWDRIYRKDAGEEPMEIGLEFTTQEETIGTVNFWNLSKGTQQLQWKQKLEVTSKISHTYQIYEYDNGIASIESANKKIENRVNIRDEIILKAKNQKSILSSTILQKEHDGIEVYRKILHFSFHPVSIRALDKQYLFCDLNPDGSNLASVLRTLKATSPETFNRIAAYLRTITGNIDLVGITTFKGYEFIDFKVDRGDKPPLEFDASGMSDGTLRALAALTAVFQIIPPHGPPSLVAIEEPETGLHPSAMQTLLSAFDEATLRTQVLITTHSPQMLEAEEVRPENIRVVQMIDGQTWIGPIDRPAREIIKNRFNTLSELEAVDRLSIDEKDLARQQRESKQEVSA
jgi:predicted ATPase